MCSIEQEPIKTYLGNKGYTILKDFIDEDEQEWIRNKLTPKPYIPGSPIQPPSFKVYNETSKKIYIPRCFGIQNYGIPDEYKIPNGDNINISFNGELRDYQKEIIYTYLNNKNENNLNESPIGLLEIPCGRGKCLGKDTPILMYDCSIKKVQDIKIGDKIMGDDSTPRTVKSLARGVETMYKIYTDSEHYIVNESHILSLKTKNNVVVDIPLIDYISNKYNEKLYGYRVSINLNDKHLNDPNIISLTPEKAYNHGWDSLIYDKSVSTKYIDTYNKNNIINRNYIKTSTKTRIQLIVGILDSNFYNQKRINIQDYHYSNIDEYNKNINYFNIVNISNQLAEDILYIARSIGWNGIKNKITQNINNKYSLLNDIDVLYNVELYLPNYEDIYSIQFLKKNKRKEWFEESYKNNIKNELSIYNIYVEKIGLDNYYGFEIDGNRRFVLGDFSVTHNTVIALNIISKLQTKTLVVVHKGFLLNQWVERIEQFLPGARIGKIQGQTIDIENKDIVIGMIQSLSMKEYPKRMFSSFGLTIVDECHHISSEVFSRTLQKIVTRCMLGLSATMERKDGLTPVFKMFLGDIVYSEKRENNDSVLVKGIEYVSNNEDFEETIYDYRGNPAFSSMITKICNYNHRSEFILKVLIKELEIKPDQQIIILAHNRNLLTYLFEAINYRKIATVGYYVGGMKECELKESETKKIIVATYSMAAEGLDIKTLSTLILATPKTDVVQAVGRILRIKHERPMIVDIVDTHDMFKKQWYKRRGFYLKSNYKVLYTNNNDYFLNKWKQNEKSTKKNISKCLIDF